jgi:hypothetical protein
MNSERIAELRELNSKRTQGEWQSGSCYYPADGSCGSCEITQVGEMGILAIISLPAHGRPAHKEGHANMRFITAITNSATELLNDAAKVLELQKENATLREEKEKAFRLGWKYRDLNLTMTQDEAWAEYQKKGEG